MLMANAVQNLAAQTPGKEAIAIEAFAKALRQVGPQKYIRNLKGEILVSLAKDLPNFLVQNLP